MARTRPTPMGPSVVLVVLVVSILGGCRGEQAEIGEGLKVDLEALQAFRELITRDPTEALREWGTQSDPCRWSGIDCDVVLSSESNKREIRVVGLELWGMELEGSLARDIGRLTELRRLVIVGSKMSGRIPPEVGNCQKLDTIDLRANRFSGPISFSLAQFPLLQVLKLSENELTGTMGALFVESFDPMAHFGDTHQASELCARLEVLDIAKNRLRGELPIEISKCAQLQELSVSENSLGGGIPSTLGSLRNLRSLQLNGNLLVGLVPESLASCQKLDLLDLSENMLTGPIPRQFAQFAGETRFNFSSNDLAGAIPQGKWKAQQMALAGAFAHNANLCGWPLAKPCAPPVLAVTTGSSSGGAVRNRRSMAEGAPGPAPSGSSPAPVASAGAQDAPAPAPAQSSESNHRARKWALGLALGIVAGAIAAALLATVLRLCVFYMHKPPYLQGPIIFHPKIEPKMLAFLEKDETFTDADLVGSGGAGKVYKAKLETDGGGMEVAVKTVIVKEDAKGLFGKRQIQAELETLGCIRHRNLVTLLAYVHRPDCHLLLYQFMKNGSLYDVMKRLESGDNTMPWPIRHRIAVGTAHGLSYLHFHCVPKIVHRDLKPSNILLDENYTAHLADFGLAKVLPGADTHVTTGVAGTVGYIAPEYSQTCRFTDKSDVYSFGVVLANLLTGKDPTDQFFHTVPGGTIGSWLHQLLQSNSGRDAIDPKLRNDEFDEEILLAMKIAVFCTSDNPAERPTSKDVLIMLNQIRVADEDPSSPNAGPAPPPIV
ncbi:hypothetical protein MPTK2_4g07140 [Marchantia polymorpha subsp. ruderalis]